MCRADKSLCLMSGRGQENKKEERQGERMETARDGCIDREDLRDQFKIWLDVMSGDGNERSAGERQ